MTSSEGMTANGSEGMHERESDVAPGWPVATPDQQATARTLRVLTVVDAFPPYVTMHDVRYSYRGVFVSRGKDLRACQRAVVFDVMQPGKPTDQGSVRYWFKDNIFGPHRGVQGSFPRGVPLPALGHDPCGRRKKFEAGHGYYNLDRPHGAIGSKVPVMLTKSGGVTSPSL